MLRGALYLYAVCLTKVRRERPFVCYIKQYTVRVGASNPGTNRRLHRHDRESAEAHAKFIYDRLISITNDTGVREALDSR